MAGKSTEKDGNSAILGASNSRKKEQDELDLEALVFGGTSGAGNWDFAEEDLAASDSEAEESEDDTGLEAVDDSNLFIIDDGNVNEEADQMEVDVVSTKPKTSRSKRTPIWTDPADETLTVSLASVSRLRKLRDTQNEDVISGRQYENRLRRQYEKLHPTPAWVTDARALLSKRRKGLSTDSDMELDQEIDQVFSIASGVKRQTQRVLSPGELDIDRLRDANQAAGKEKQAGIVSIGFHPTTQVLFSASSDRRLKLFKIDGTENPMLQAMQFTELPISAASFHPSGSSILVTGNRPFFMSYDLQSGSVLRSPRGLLTQGLGGADKEATGGAGGLERFSFSPDGEYLAIGGRRGYVHIVNWGSNGVGNGGQVIAEVKMNTPCKDISWRNGGKELVTLGANSEVYVWDIGTRNCISRWRDEGGFGSEMLVTDNAGKYTAIGSTSGIVNLYDDTISIPVSGSEISLERKALKAIENLTTTVSTIKFNHDSQLMAIASKVDKDQLKLVHLPTASIYSNWPTSQTPLHNVTSVDFSKGSEYLAIGNARGKVLLYNVKQFNRP